MSGAGTAEAFSDKRVLLIDRRTLRSDHDEENWSNRVYALTPGSKSFLQGKVLLRRRSRVLKLVHPSRSEWC